MVSAVTTRRSNVFHIKASPIQPHEWYHEMYAGTMCGRWIRVEEIESSESLASLIDAHDLWCEKCLGRVRRFVDHG
jgi:hypothetical protein